jgi:hypothetical protein
MGLMLEKGMEISAVLALAEDDDLLHIAFDRFFWVLGDDAIFLADWMFKVPHPTWLCLQRLVR